MGIGGGETPVGVSWVGWGGWERVRGVGDPPPWGCPGWALGPPWAGCGMQEAGGGCGHRAQSQDGGPRLGVPGWGPAGALRLQPESQPMPGECWLDAVAS